MKKTMILVGMAALLLVFVLTGCTAWRQELRTTQSATESSMKAAQDAAKRAEDAASKTEAGIQKAGIVAC